MIAAVDPQMLALMLRSPSAKKAPIGNAALAAASPTAAATNPQLLAAQLQAQNVQGQLQANQQGAQQMRGGALELGARLLAQALLSGQAKKANTNLAQAQIAQRMGAAQQFFPNDPTGQLLYLTDPESATKALAMRYQPQDVRQGNTLLNAPTGVAGANGSAPGTFTAPIYGVNNDRPTVQGPQGMQMQPVQPAGGAPPMSQLPMGYTQQTNAQNANTQQANQQETAAQNQRADALRQQEIAVAQQQAAASAAQAMAAQRNAATSAGNLNLNQSTTPSFALPPGYVLGGPPK